VKRCNKQLYLSPIEGVEGDEFGYLRSPRRQIAPIGRVRNGAWWAFDNDCFNNGLNIETWSKSLFAHLPYRDRCLFVVSPDVVGDYRATLEHFAEYQPRIVALGYPVALATQDGLTPDAVPWEQVDALFIGGSNKHKTGPEARALIDAAKEHGKWVHVGRVNSRHRLLHFYDCDSWDGTCIAIAPKNRLKIARWVREARARRASPNMLKELIA
jgi:hypothetical protein